MKDEMKRQIQQGTEMQGNRGWHDAAGPDAKERVKLRRKARRKLKQAVLKREKP